MTQALSRLVLIFLPLFAGALVVIHAQPFDDPDLRAFLLPENCVAPCWEGIRPGVTTLDEAVALLQANPWVERAVVKRDTPFTFLYVDWSDQAPAFAENVASRLPTYMWVQRNIIQLIVVPTLIPYAEIWSLLGTPNTGSFAVSGYRHSLTLGTRPNTRHTALYFGGRVMFDTRVYCPISPALFWNAPVTITYDSAVIEPVAARQQYDLVQWIYSPPCNS